jgi:hypothetical protein
MLSGSAGVPEGPSGALWNLIPSGWFCHEQVIYCRMFDQFLLP